MHRVANGSVCMGAEFYGITFTELVGMQEVGRCFKFQFASIDLDASVYLLNRNTGNIFIMPATAIEWANKSCKTAKNHKRQLPHLPHACSSDSEESFAKFDLMLLRFRIGKHHFAGCSSPLDHGLARILAVHAFLSLAAITQRLFRSEKFSNEQRTNGAKNARKCNWRTKLD